MYNGQYVKAGGEVASGLISCIPFVGTALGLTIDATMAAHDGYEVYAKYDKILVLLKDPEKTMKEIKKE